MMIGYLTSLYLIYPYPDNIGNACSALEAGWRWLRLTVPQLLM